MAKEQGWHGDSKGHAKAAKGDTNAKGTPGATPSTGQGWHGDSKGHAKAAKGKNKTEGEGIASKLFGSD